MDNSLGQSTISPSKKLILMLIYLVPFIVLSLSIEYLYVSSFSYLHIVNRVLLILVLTMSMFILEGKYDLRNVLLYLGVAALFIALNVKYERLTGNKIAEFISHYEYRHIIIILGGPLLATIIRYINRNKR